MKTNSVAFIDIKLKEVYESLENSSEKQLYKFIRRAIDDLKENPACGKHIPRKLIPKKYTKEYRVTNLWKYDLPNSWRLLYTIKDNEVEIIAVILEWMNHKEYDRLFSYRTT